MKTYEDPDEIIVKRTGDEETCSKCGREYQRSLKGLHNVLCPGRYIRVAKER